MKQMATVWHDEAEKTKNESTYALAEQAYEGFLKTFPKDKDAYEIQMYYAELLWARASALTTTRTRRRRRGPREVPQGPRRVHQGPRDQPGG
jgi:uncharacterized protein YozE (UPF0346 family)